MNRGEKAGGGGGRKRSKERGEVELTVSPNRSN